MFIRKNNKFNHINLQKKLHFNSGGISKSIIIKFTKKEEF